MVNPGKNYNMLDPGRRDNMAICYNMMNPWKGNLHHDEPREPLSHGKASETL